MSYLLGHLTYPREKTSYPLGQMVTLFGQVSYLLGQMPYLPGQMSYPPGQAAPGWEPQKDYGKPIPIKKPFPCMSV
jgi:hypothetical protein